MASVINRAVDLLGTPVNAIRTRIFTSPGVNESSKSSEQSEIQHPTPDVTNETDLVFTGGDKNNGPVFASDEIREPTEPLPQVTNITVDTNTQENKPLSQRTRSQRGATGTKDKPSAKTKTAKKSTKAKDSVTEPPKMCLTQPLHVIPPENQINGRCSYDAGCIWSEFSSNEAIQCDICNGKYHNQCVGVTDMLNLNFWACPICSTAGKTVKILLSDMAEIKQIMKQIQENNCDLKYDLARKTAECQALAVENAVLKERLNNVHDKRSDTEHVVESSGNLRKSNDSNRKVLIIGGSNLRSVKKFVNQTDNVVHVMPGAKFTNVRDYLSKHVAKDDFRQIILHIGTVDCSSDIVLDVAINNAETLIKLAKNLATDGNVLFSSICPRTDIDEANKRAYSVNEALQKFCLLNGVKFLDNNLTFTYKDNSVDSRVLGKDGLHLNKEGGRRLAANFALYAGIQRNVVDHYHATGKSQTKVRAASFRSNRNPPKTQYTYSGAAAPRTTQYHENSQYMDTHRSTQQEYHNPTPISQRATERRNPDRNSNTLPSASYGWVRKPRKASQRAPGSYYSEPWEFSNNAYQEQCELPNYESFDHIQCWRCWNYGHFQRSCPYRTV